MAAAPAPLPQALRTKRAASIQTTAATCPTNTALPLRTGAPVLRRRKQHPAPEGFRRIDRLRSERRPAWSLVAGLTDPAPWRPGPDALGPLAGCAAPRPSPRPR